MAQLASKVSACRDGEPGSAAKAISVWPGSPVSANQVRTDRHVIDLGQMRLDVPDGRARCVEPQDDLVDAVQAALTLTHNLRLEAAGPVPRGLQLHRPGLGQHRLGHAAVARVPAASSGRITGLVAQMVSELLGQGGLQHRLHHLTEQPGVSSDVQALLAGLGDQASGEVGRDQSRFAGVTPWTTDSSSRLASFDTVGRVIGQDVYDKNGERIGSASEVFLDDETGKPEWVTVRTGLFGTKESFVPIRDVDLTSDGVRVRVSKQRIKGAPMIDTDGHLTPEEEEELYRYYGVGADATVTTTTSGTTTVPTDPTGGDVPGTVGHDAFGIATGNETTPSEERMNAGSESEDVGRARLHKYVVSENVTGRVSVSREEVRVEREPITDTNVVNDADGPAIGEEEHGVVLYAERPAVEEVEPVERVRLDTQTVTEQETVSGYVRRAEIEVDGDTTTRDRRA